eukprot:CAMPEP_0185188604 /NCGR_PEP_ID=MMETSP1140-20130426/5518_1 /TAXON_ID=298111 /ORGANISM="Pavlova sp., Strain CCMP459" /LENGTH=60 /DNA_ID=CAMNT_0027755117 /DNA_START=187 /DNA_END=369 /DNA_ORIENTATION=-
MPHALCCAYHHGHGGATLVAYEDVSSMEDDIGNHGLCRDLHMCISSNIPVRIQSWSSQAR